jgi:hypothetical protein
MKTKKLIKQLEYCIQFSIENKENLDEFDWDDKIGILISRRYAEKFLKLLKKERDSKRIVKKIMEEITCGCGEVLEFNETGEKKCPKCEKYKKYRHDTLMSFQKEVESYYENRVCGGCGNKLSIVRTRKYQCDNPKCKSNEPDK